MSIVEEAILREIKNKGINQVKLVNRNYLYILDKNTLYINGNLKLNRLTEVINCL